VMLRIEGPHRWEEHGTARHEASHGSVGSVCAHSHQTHTRSRDHPLAAQTVSAAASMQWYCSLVGSGSVHDVHWLASSYKGIAAHVARESNGSTRRA
jgi:hypothetical protein